MVQVVQNKADADIRKHSVMQKERVHLHMTFSGSRQYKVCHIIYRNHVQNNIALSQEHIAPALHDESYHTCCSSPVVYPSYNWFFSCCCYCKTSNTFFIETEIRMRNLSVSSIKHTKWAPAQEFLCEYKLLTNSALFF